MMAFNTKDKTPVFTQELADQYFKHHSPYTHKPVKNKYNIVQTPEGERVEECRSVVVHEFRMSDVEDPDLWAAQSLYEWEHSEQGQWVMKNAADTPSWHRTVDPITYGHLYQIRAYLMGPALTEWLLRNSR